MLRTGAFLSLLMIVSLVSSALGQSEDAKVAVRALRSFDAVARGGTIYRVYVERLNDVRIAAAPFNKNAPAGPAKEAVNTAIGFYALADLLWSASSKFGRDMPQEMRQLMRDSPCSYTRKLDGEAITFDAAMTSLFDCASDETAKAERLLAPGRPTSSKPKR